MKCVKCNNELRENDKFCPICGTPVKKANDEVVSQNAYTYESIINKPINQERQFNNTVQQNNNYGQMYDRMYARNRNINNVNSAGITNNTIKIFGIIIIVLIAFAVVIIFGTKMFKFDEKIINEGSGNTNLQSLSDSSTNGQGGDITQVSKTDSYKVNYKGFQFYIPNNLVYLINSYELNISDVKSTWIADLDVEQASFEQLKKQKNYLDSYLMEGYKDIITFSEAKVENIGGVEYILIECTMEGEKSLIGIAGINSMYVIYFEIVNENNEFDREHIKSLSPIISTAEYIGESSYIKLNDNINMTSINKAIEETIKGGE